MIISPVQLSVVYLSCFRIVPFQMVKDVVPFSIGVIKVGCDVTLLGRAGLAGREEKRPPRGMAGRPERALCLWLGYCMEVPVTWTSSMFQPG